MKKITIIIFLLLISFLTAIPQTNQTDSQGRKQGHWIRKYPNGATMYDGTFVDNHPAGEFKRFYENGKLKSVLVFSPDGIQADAVLYYQNGRLAAKGKYIDQKKEGKWQFFSEDEDGYMVSEQNFKADKREGLSLGFYRDGKIGDRTMYSNNEKTGPWEQFYSSGAPYIKSSYAAGMLNGKYEVWYENGRKMYSGTYRYNRKDGSWLVYNEDGSVKYRINYIDGNPDNRQMEKDASAFIDTLEKQKGTIPDPEKTGIMW